ncbi:MAG: YCF48-related protein [Pseudomonadota bacterium]
MHALSGLLCTAMAAMWYAVPAAVLAAPPEPLDSAAVMSPLSRHSVLVAVARAQSRLVAAGERGHIIYSDDNGATWTQAMVPVSVTLTALRFADGRRGWAVGNGAVILRTDDGGATWTKQFDGRALLATLQASVEGLADERKKRLLHEGADKPFLDIYVSTPDKALAVGAYGLMFATADGGASWQPAFGRLAQVEERHLYAVRKIGAAVYLAGEQGLLYRSLDNGATFQPFNAPGKGTYFALLGERDDLLLLGLRGAAYHSRDAGANWRKIDIPSKNSLTGGRMSADGQAFVLVDDGGGAWRVSRLGDEVRRLATSTVFPFAGMEIAADGALVIVGALGFAQVLR